MDYKNLKAPKNKEDDYEAEMMDDEMDSESNMDSMDSENDIATALAAFSKEEIEEYLATMDSDMDSESMDSEMDSEEYEDELV
jgi:hypothetical protein